MSIKTRLDKLERIGGDDGRINIGIYYREEEIVVSNGERLPLAEWERLHPNALKICIEYRDGVEIDAPKTDTSVSLPHNGRDPLPPLPE